MAAEDLGVFQWFYLLVFESQLVKVRNLFDISNYLPAWIVYSFSGELWAYSFMFYISIIWGDVKV